MSRWPLFATVLQVAPNFGVNLEEYTNAGEDQHGCRYETVQLPLLSTPIDESKHLFCRCVGKRDTVDRNFPEPVHRGCSWAQHLKLELPTGLCRAERLRPHSPFALFHHRDIPNVDDLLVQGDCEGAANVSVQLDPIVVAQL